MKSEMVLWQTSRDVGRVWDTTDVQKSTRSSLSDPCVICKQGSSVQQLCKICHDKMPKSYLPNSYYRDPGKNKWVSGLPFPYSVSGCVCVYTNIFTKFICY